MLFSVRSFAFVVTVAAVGSAIALSASAAVAAETYTSLTMTNCPVFAGPAWTSWMVPHNAGTKYGVTLSTVVKVVGGKKTITPPMTCSGAELWVKKMAAEHIAGAPGQAAYPPLKTGPPNFVCKGSPDNNGQAWRGTCYLKAPYPAPSFTWFDD